MLCGGWGRRGRCSADVPRTRECRPMPSSGRHQGLPIAVGTFLWEKGMLGIDGRHATKGELRKQPELKHKIRVNEVTTG